LNGEPKLDPKRLLNLEPDDEIRFAHRAELDQSQDRANAGRKPIVRCRARLVTAMETIRAFLDR